MKQSFLSAAEAFDAIDSTGQGVIVPYGDVGKHIITALCGSFNIGEQRQILKKAQRYSVNIFKMSSDK
jgi:CRISPR-associated endonuclease/helicase Cas3